MSRRAKSSKHTFFKLDIMQECRDYAEKHFHTTYDSLEDSDKNNIYKNVALLGKR